MAPTPDELLRLAREAAHELSNCDLTPGSNEAQLVEAFTSLDDWLSEGGAPPAGWSRVAGG